MLKQHCEICDQVIPITESYRTIHFGRGHNPNINIGFDPLVICKNCWKKMLASVNAESAYKDVDATFDESKNRNITIPPDTLDNIVGKLTKQIQSDDKSCKNCKHAYNNFNDSPCNDCVGKSNWEETTNE